MRSIGALLRLSRLRAGLTQAELAERVRTDRTHITRIELGHVSPSVDLLSRLACVLRIGAYELGTAVLDTQSEADLPLASGQ